MEEIVNDYCEARNLFSKQQEGESEVNERCEAPGTLDPDHPLLQKFQKSLKEHLLRVQNELQNDIADLDQKLKYQKEEIEEVGSKLYDNQQHVKRNKKLLEDYAVQIKETSEKRRKNEENVAILRKEYESGSKSYVSVSNTHKDMMQELNHLIILENNLNKWVDEIDAEVKVAKRIMNKDSKDTIAMAEEKKKMDLFLFSLDAEVSRRETELHNINLQITEQEQLNSGLSTTISDANCDLDSLQTENKRMIAAWSDVIKQIGGRDRVLAKLQKELDQIIEDHKSIRASIEGAKKQSAQEMEINERLEKLRMRFIIDMEQIKTQNDSEERELDKVIEKNNKFLDVIKVTENDINKARTEGIIIEQEYKKIQSKFGSLNARKHELETGMLDILQEQYSTDQAISNRIRQLRETQEHRRTSSLAMAKTEHQLSGLLLELEKMRGNIDRAKERANVVNNERAKVVAEYEKIDADIRKIMVELNIKKKRIDLLNKRIITVIDSQGGQEMSPMEIKVMTMEKNIAELESLMRETQGFWLRAQGHVVSLSERRAQQMNDIHIAQKQLLVIEQKTLKVEQQLEKLNKLDQETKRELNNLSTKLTLLGSKLYAERNVHEADELSCEETHATVIIRLKDAEMNNLCLQQEHDDIMKEIEELKIQVMEMHREALSWETKWKMAVETKKLRDQEKSTLSDIGCMKTEIHRMEVRYAQLKKAQYKLMDDLEHCVTHREHIYNGANARQKAGLRKNQSRASVQFKLNEKKNKLKQITKELKACKAEIAEAEAEKDQYDRELHEKFKVKEEVNCDHCCLVRDVDLAVLRKQYNLDEIVRRQQRAKKYKILNCCKTIPKVPTEEAIINDEVRYQHINDQIYYVLRGLVTDFPEYQQHFKKIITTLRNALPELGGCQ